MENNQYTVLAKYYDRLNSEIDYKSWAEFIREIFDKYYDNVDLVLDLACGSGNMTVELAKLGYNMIGIDLSVDMLMKAREKSFSIGSDILWSNQDMCDFELYGSVDAAVCCLDSVNYIINEENLSKCFGNVYYYLNPSGLFVFDVNSKYKFENIYAEHDYVLEIGDDIVCTWQNYYDEITHICDFYLNIFAKKSNGSYDRYFERQCERMYTNENICKVLERNKFRVLDIVSDYKFSPISEKDERYYFICQAIK